MSATQTALVAAWGVVAAAWLWVGSGIAASPGAGLGAVPGELAGRWRATLRRWREVGAADPAAALRMSAVGFWIFSLFINASASFGPVEHLRLVDLASLVLVVVLLTRDPGKPLALPDASVVLLGLAVYGLGTAAVAVDQKTAVLGSIQLAELAVAAVALVSFLLESDEEERRLYVNLFVFLASAEALLAVVQTLTSTGVSGTARGEGTLSLSLAFFLSIALLYAVWRILATPERRLLWIGIAGLLGAGVIASQTRTSWVGAFLGILVLLALERPRLAVLFAGSVVAAVILLSLASRVVQWQSGQFGVLQRFDSITQLAEGHTQAVGNWTLTSARVAYWKASVHTIRRHPLGIGLKNFRRTLPQLTRQHLAPEFWQAAKVEGPHNQYLFTTVELGLPGGLLLLVLLGTAALTAVRLRTRARALVIGLLVLIAAETLVADILFGVLGMVTVGLLAVLDWQRRREASFGPPAPGSSPSSTRIVPIEQAP